MAKYKMPAMRAYRCGERSIHAILVSMIPFRQRGLTRDSAVAYCVGDLNQKGVMRRIAGGWLWLTDTGDIRDKRVA